MIALMVFVVLMLIFASCIPVARKAASANGQYSQAISLCQHKIDQLRAVGYGRADDYNELSDAGIIDDAPSTRPYSFSGVDEVSTYLPNATTSLQIDDSVADQLKITVTITWKTTTFETKSSTATLSAMITNVE